MIAKSRLKLLIWAGLVVLAALAVAGTLLLLGRVVLHFNSGADPASALNLIPALPADIDERLYWMADHPNVQEARQMELPTRQMELPTRQAISDAYLRAWAQLGIAYELDQPYGLKTYFSGQALEQVSRTLTETVAAGWQINRTNLRHELELYFYSDDGSIVAFTDHNSRLVQHIRRADSGLSQLIESADVWQVLMLLQDGNWRIIHLRRTGEAENASLPLAAARDPSTPFVRATGKELRRGDERFVIAGVNYYPQEAAWAEFWPNYSPAVTAHDLALAHQLGLNTLRTFVPFVDPKGLSGPALTGAYGGDVTLDQILAGLHDFLDQAADADVKVIVTLFDHRTDHHPANWPADDRYLAALIPPFADHPALLAWDLKNEADTDAGFNTEERVDAWLLHVGREVRRHDPNHLLTVGWFSADYAARSPVSSQLDFVSFHYFGTAPDLPGAWQALADALPDKPILLGEFGMSTWNSLWPDGHTEGEQAAYYAGILAGERRFRSAGYLAWTLHEYTNVTLPQYRLPWISAKQARLGVVRLDGTFKPAALLLTPGADLTVAPIPGWRRFVKPFWLALMAGGLAVVSIAILLWRRRKQ
jgi:hypothetical protein